MILKVKIKDTIMWGEDPCFVTNLLEVKSDIREIKLSLLMDRRLSIDISQNSILDFIVRNDLHKYVITGSIALKLYGLLDRYTNDIDLVTTTRDRDGYSNNTYLVEKGRLGYLKVKDKLNIWNLFKREEHNCDFFLDENVSYREFEYNGNVLKLQEPIAIINAKMSILENIFDNSTQRNWDALGFSKHKADIKKISNILS